LRKKDRHNYRCNYIILLIKLIFVVSFLFIPETTASAELQTTAGCHQQHDAINSRMPSTAGMPTTAGIPTTVITPEMMGTPIAEGTSSAVLAVATQGHQPQQGRQQK
jgi:hypothetical protein